MNNRITLIDQRFIGGYYDGFLWISCVEPPPGEVLELCSLETHKQVRWAQYIWNSVEGYWYYVGYANNTSRRKP